MNSKQKDETDLLEDLSDHSESATENMESIVNLDEFSGELTLETAEMDTEESELIGAASMEEEHEEELFENEIASHEVEIPSDDQEMPEKKLKTTPASSSSSSVPPLRLLNIAPKPDHQSPLSVKSINGQQVILVPGAQTSGQTIKFVSPQGQEINLANLSLNRPTIALKQTGSKISLAGNSASVLQQQSSTTIQPKQIIMKKVINATNSSSTGKVISKPTITVNNNKPGQQQQKQFVVVQKSNNEVIHHPPQKIKFVQSVAGSNISAASGAVSKTITMQQAQQLGLFGNNKLFQNNLQSSVQSAPKRTVLINKSLPKTIKIVPQIATTNQIVHNTASVSTTTCTTTTTGNNIKTIPLGQVKSPTKILPATSSFTVMPGTGIKPPQKIILKSSGGSQVLSAGQLIQVAGTQGLANGQIHQINVPGKGIQYIKFVAATTASDSTKTSIINTVKTTITTTTTVPDKKPVLAAPKFVTKPNTAKTTQLMIVPAGYLPATVVQPSTQKLQISSMKVGAQNKSISAPNKASSAPSTASPSAETSAVSPNDSQSVAASNTSLSTSTIASNGIRPRKPCNCAKSQCLKLYCDCFANGEFCYLCNCMNCFNNLDNEESRNLAIKACLERNSQAFRPKIGKAKDTTGDVLRKHTKGCNCKRSGCLKNYCECYEAKIACSGNCKCVSCRNTEDGIERRANEASSAKLHQISDEELVQAVYANLPPSYHHKQSHLSRSKKPNNSKKQAISFITDDVIEATCECLLTISDDADSNQQDEEITKQQIIEEFGVCLSDIISCSLNKRNNTAS